MHEHPDIDPRRIVHDLDAVEGAILELRKISVVAAAVHAHDGAFADRDPSPRQIDEMQLAVGFLIEAYEVAVIRLARAFHGSDVVRGDGKRVEN